MELWLGNIATMNGEVDYGTIMDAAMIVERGKVVWLGAASEVSDHYNQQVTQVHDYRGYWITPALIDCHTHLIYGGNRSNEFEARLNGISYADIAKSGGGILATVKATREASEDELYQSAGRRLLALIREGLGTIEIKSGYGLDLASERKMLRVARRLQKDYGICVRNTYLAAHAIPSEFIGQEDIYVDKVCLWMEILHQEGLIDAVDGFCENIAFSTAQMQIIFEKAKSLGLPVKLHAEQLSNQEGASLVAAYNGLSADHLEFLSDDGILAMKAADTVAVLLPGAFYTLRETKLPPISKLREARVPIAVSTDSNPGTSPLTSILLSMNMACTLFALTPQEALAGVTVHAAKALGLSGKGQLSVGMDADFAIWRIDRPADLSYLIGFNPLKALILNGKGYSIK